MCKKRMWKEYVDTYHKFWDYLERHEELLQKEDIVNKIRRVMEECPVVNFSCVRDLMYTMRQMAGEKRFNEGKRYWTERLRSKVDRCIENISRKDLEDFQKKEKEQKEDLGCEVNPNYNFLQRHQLIDRVLKEFAKRTDCLLEKHHQLLDLPVPKYQRQVYGQDIFRQQGLILNFNILRTFCNNVMKYFELEPRQCCDLLRRITDEALDPEGMCFQAAHWYKDLLYKDQPEILTRISVWPLHEPVLSSYSDRKEALSKRCEAHKDLKSDVPEIYTLRCPGEDPWHTQKGRTVPTKLRDSRHFKRVMDIVQTKREKYGLCHDETDPFKKSNWVYYCVMFDPTVSPEAGDQGYIGETERSLVERWKEHVGSKGKHDDSLVHYNLTLVNQYAQQRGEQLSDYVAVFALGSTTKETRKYVEGMLIRETMEGGFSVTNMKYGMNGKQGANNPNE